MVDGSATDALIDSVTDEFTEFEPPDVPDEHDPLRWPGYSEQHASAVHRTGHDEAVRCGHGTLGSREAVLIAFDFAFLGGSVGAATGARIVHAFERARQLRVPIISLVTSGGSRMQEGIRALSQLQEIARAALLARQERIPHVTVLRHPTTGGMWAALSAAADVVLATPGATVAFGGSRVRGDGDTTAFTAEGKFEGGQVDRIVADADLSEVLRQLITLLHPSELATANAAGTPEPAEVPHALGAMEYPKTGWDAVCRARGAARPRAGEYLEAYFDTRFELAGDRAGGHDPGVRCGVGTRAGRTIAFAAQTGTANSPAGFRTAARLVRFADQFGVPVLTLIDTPGAANDADAEHAGLGPAIAEVFTAVVGATVPVTSLVVGEGGSGGALALAAPGRTWITPDAYFAVIAPESAAAILKREPTEVPELSGWMRLRPQDLVALGFAHAAGQ